MWKLLQLILLIAVHLHSVNSRRRRPWPRPPACRRKGSVDFRVLGYREIEGEPGRGDDQPQEGALEFFITNGKLDYDMKTKNFSITILNKTTLNPISYQFEGNVPKLNTMTKFSNAPYISDMSTGIVYKKNGEVLVPQTILRNHEPSHEPFQVSWSAVYGNKILYGGDGVDNKRVIAMSKNTEQKNVDFSSVFDKISEKANDTLTHEAVQFCKDNRRRRRRGLHITTIVVTIQKRDRLCMVTIPKYNVDFENPNILVRYNRGRVGITPIDRADPTLSSYTGFQFLPCSSETIMVTISEGIGNDGPISYMSVISSSGEELLRDTLIMEGTATSLIF